MKILSSVEGGGRVVELTLREWNELQRLVMAVDGLEVSDLWEFKARGDGYAPSQEDYHGTFGAIRAFYEAHFRVNELKHTVENLEKVIWKQ